MVSDNVATGRPLTLSIIAALSFAASTASAASQVTCVGDSITYGAGSSDPATKAYPVQLGTLLGAGYTVENDGHSGATLLHNGDLPYNGTAEYTQSTATALARGGDVVIMLGTNDTKPQNWANKANFESDCEAMVDHYMAVADAGSPPPRVWINLPSPDWPAGDPPTNQYGIDGQILKNETIPLLQQCALAKGVSTIDVYSALLNFQADFSDGVHPNDDGAGRIAQAVHDALVKLPTISLAAAAVSFGAGTPVVVNATATAAYGKVQSVEIFEGTTSLGKSTTAPFTVTITGLSVGSHMVTGRVTETGGRTADSSPAIELQVEGALGADLDASTSSGFDAGPAIGNDDSSLAPDAGSDAGAPGSFSLPESGCNVARGSEGFVFAGLLAGVLLFLQRKLRARK